MISLLITKLIFAPTPAVLHIYVMQVPLELGVHASRSHHPHHMPHDFWPMFCHFDHGTCSSSLLGLILVEAVFLCLIYALLCSVPTTLVLLDTDKSYRNCSRNKQSQHSVREVHPGVRLNDWKFIRDHYVTPVASRIVNDTKFWHPGRGFRIHMKGKHLCFIFFLLLFLLFSSGELSVLNGLCWNFLWR